MPLSRPRSLSCASSVAPDSFLPLMRHGVALLEADLDLGHLVRRFHRRDGALVDVGRRLDRRIFQHFAFGGRVQQVGVDRERRLAALVLGDRDLVLLGELDEVGARLELPCPPRRDDLDRRVQRVGRQLETHLVIALAGRAVGDGVGAGFLGDLDKALGDQRAARSRCRAGTGLHRRRWRGTSGRRSRARIPRARPR